MQSTAGLYTDFLLCGAPSLPMPLPECLTFGGEQVDSSSSHGLCHLDEREAGWERRRGSLLETQKAIVPSLSDPAVLLLLEITSSLAVSTAICSHNQITLLSPGMLKGMRSSESYKYNTLHTDLNTQGETPCN